MFPSTARRLHLIRGRTKPPWGTAFFPLRTARQISSTTFHGTGDPLVANNIPPGIHQAPSGADLEEPEFWRKVPIFKDTSRDEFFSWRWNVKNIVERKEKLLEILDVVVPEKIPRAVGIGDMQSRHEFAGDVVTGMKRSTMSVRLTPYILSMMNWADPANCPVFRQFVPLGSIMMKDHPNVELDSLHERKDSPVDGVVHRYPDRALFLAISVCPVYCVFCTRSYGVGADTFIVVKGPFKLSRSRFEAAFAYIESQGDLKDIVVSGGDAYYLPPHILEWIGDSLIGMKNIERFRFATKGLAVAPNRILDDNDPWVKTLIRVADKARRADKHFALHTHFNNPNEISSITERASSKLIQAGITIRNQSVLLRGVNDSVDIMLSLIKKLARMNIQPYYVYQCDMVPKVEHFRTPLQTSLDIESQIRGSITGFFMPNFVVDLPGGGGKRLACSFESYDRNTGVSTFRAPALKAKGRRP
ncbi:L-lysine-aminomutase [Xylaria sp. FL1777]|nr:L-lysine-aminomutase [Xylaria sp. FL1777]